MRVNYDLDSLRVATTTKSRPAPLAFTVQNIDVAALEAYSAPATDAAAAGADSGHDRRIARAAPRTRA